MNPANLIIREARLTDYGQFLKLFAEIEELHRINAPWMFKKPEKELFPKNYFWETINNSDALFFFAFEGNDLVGYILGFKKHSQEREILRKRLFISLDDLCVRKTHQARGIGRLLMEKIENIAKKDSISSIELNVWAFNTGAISFYNKLGYSTFSQKMRKEIN